MVGRIHQPVTTHLPAVSPSSELARPRLNQWSSVAETRLPRAAHDLALAHGMAAHDVMLVGPSEFVFASRTGGDALVVAKHDPDDLQSAFVATRGTVSATGTFTPRASGEPAATSSSHTHVVGDASLTDSTTRRPLAGGLATRLGGARDAVLFSDLPRAVQDEVKRFLASYHESESASMSPRSREFTRAKKLDDGYEVTFHERDWTGKSRGDVTHRFVTTPAEPARPAASGAPITSLDALASTVRAAIEAHLEVQAELESMSMSPRSFSFVSATPFSDDTHQVVIRATGLFGGGEDIALTLSKDLRLS